MRPETSELELAFAHRNQQGDFVDVRGRPWVVEAVEDSQADLTALRLSCIADDALGEQIEIIWDAEIGASVLSMIGAPKSQCTGREVELALDRG